MTAAQLAMFEAKPYDVPPNPKLLKKQGDDEVIKQALSILASRLRVRKFVFNSPESVQAYCRLQLGGLEHEEFGVLFLDAQHRLIEFRSLFRGTLKQTSVYPREVVKIVLALNADSVIFTHNHPSGTAQPSRADELLTQTLKQALSLIDCRVMDHIIVTADGSLSMAAAGLM